MGVKARPSRGPVGRLLVPARPGGRFNFLGVNLRHSGVWLSDGARVERWLISPAQHRLHHAPEPADREQTGYRRA